MTGLYDRLVMPRLIEVACSHHKIARLRERIVPEASGTVVEIGIGAGHNLGYYDPARVRRVIGVDRNPAFWDLGGERFTGAAVEIELIEGNAESLTLPGGIADTVVVTYTLCSIDDVAAALAEIRRVLKPTGRLLFVEHGCAPDAATARWQARLTPLTRALAGGCRLERNTGELISTAGFSFDRLDTEWALRAPRIASYHYIGAARPA